MHAGLCVRAAKFDQNETAFTRCNFTGKNCRDAASPTVRCLKNEKDLLFDIEEDIVSAKIRYPGVLYHPSNCSERAHSCG